MGRCPRVVDTAPSAWRSRSQAVAGAVRKLLRTTLRGATLALVLQPQDAPELVRSLLLELFTNVRPHAKTPAHGAHGTRHLAEHASSFATWALSGGACLPC